MMTKRELIEEVWRNSNLTWQQAEKIINDAIEMGKVDGYREADSLVA
jgi:nucleoid DNA-binding protein